MPASDQTWYNLKRLHKTFAVSSVLLLLATLLWFAVDHSREWKKIQRTSDRIEVRFAEWRRLQQLTEDMQAERQRLSEALFEAQAGALSSDVLQEFREEMVADAARRHAEPTDFAELESRLQSLEPAVEAVQKATRRWQESRLAEDKATLEAQDAEKRVAEGDEEASLRRAAEAASKLAAEAKKAVESALQEKETAQAVAVPFRESVLDWLRETIRAARFREDEALRQRKLASADLDAGKAERDIALRKALSESQIKRLSVAIQQKQEVVSKATLAFEDAAAHRQSLQRLLNRLTDEEASIQERLAENQDELRRLDQLLEEKRSAYFTFNGFIPVPGKRWLELPVLDAFNSPRKINNVWSDDLDRKLGSFGRVHRFDRCTTCHQAIDKVDPSDPTREAYLSARTIDLFIGWPERPPEAWQLSVAEEKSIEQQLDALLGIQFADDGLLNASDVTVRFVRPASLAAEAATSLPDDSMVLGGILRDQWFETASTSIGSPPATRGMLVGDVITAINGVAIDDERDDPRRVARQLLDAATAHWQAAEDGAETVPALHLTVQRGLPSPYHSHPRLDLYLGSFSPHKLSEFGCTVCHEGQGSATAFKWSSHTPNDELTRQRWREEFGWFDNPHWAFPMNPKRIVESACLKCHHNVTELEVSDRFSEPAAPQVVRGNKLIRKNGCFGCHEINGYDGTGKRVGPDMRVEPNYAAVAAQFKDARGTGYENLTVEEKKWVEQLIAGPERADVRHKLYSMLIDDARFAARSRDAILSEPDENAGAEDDSTPRFSRYVHRELTPLLRDQENPGTLRKVGPSLRHVGHKLDVRSVVQWVARPSSFRPSTSMPQFFGLWRHLPDLGDQNDEANNAVARPEQDLERVEVVSMVQFLLQRTQPFAYELPPEGVAAVTTEEEKQEQIERGKIAFEERGCLACHSHVDFPEMEAFRERDVLSHGPDLSDLSAKFGMESNPNGPQWLYSWIKNPMGYHPRTRMPDSDLAPISHRDETGKVFKVTDPADDITAYLLSVAAPNAQTDLNPSGSLSSSENQALTRLAKEYLRDAVFEKTADRFVEQGIPADRRSEFSDAELELVVSEEEVGQLTEEALSQKRLLYVGRKSIAKHGCYACHDIPGFEAAKPIGPELSEWGRVDPHKLAFEHVVQYVTQDKEELGVASRESDRSESTATQQDVPDSANRIPEYYRHQLKTNSRIGFIYQKVSEPRSYDYRKTEVKRYNERLRMPQFRFDDAQREAIITFVLGLVADPPRSKYVYRPDERSKRLSEGWELLDKYNCGGCHVLDAEKWELAFEPGDFGRQIASSSFPFLTARFGEEQLAASRVVDRRGLRRATIEGMPSISDDGKPAILEDGEFPLEEEEEEEFDTSLLTYRFELWKPAVLDGHVYQVGEVPLLISKSQIERRQATVGGDLAKYLLPRVVRREQDENPDAKGREAWGWLPPSLVGEGRRVQPAWLHNYLIDPHVIRPAVALKMPRFNLSSSEAQILADYFAVKDHAPFPYEFDRQQQAKYLAEANARYADVLAKLRDAGGEGQDKTFAGRHLDDAMKIVTDANYCIKCHIVGDFDPVATDRAKAPDLSLVYRRLRSDYLRRWVARPSSVLPYTSMPINIPYAADEDFLGTTVPQDLYHGTSLEQLEALVDLLMNYDQYARQRSPISPLVRQQNTDGSGQVEPSSRPNP